MRGVEIRLGVTDRIGRDQRQVAGIGKVDQRVFGGRFHRIITAHDLDIEPVREDLLKLVQIRSEEHTSELQSLMRISYAVFCLKKKKLTGALTQSAVRSGHMERAHVYITATNSHIASSLRQLK